MQWNELNLLIADDDRDFRESISEVFTRRGFSTHLAADGEEAVEIVETKSELHLILLDVHMPRLSGLEAFAKIQAMAERQLPCILMSAQFDEQIRAEAMQLDVSSLLSKPFTLRDLTGTVETILQNSYGWEG